VLSFVLGMVNLNLPRRTAGEAVGQVPEYVYGQADSLFGCHNRHTRRRSAGSMEGMAGQRRKVRLMSALSVFARKEKVVKIF
jgi:hypothetical protein